MILLVHCISFLTSLQLIRFVHQYLILLHFLFVLFMFVLFFCVPLLSV